MTLTPEKKEYWVMMSEAYMMFGNRGLSKTIYWIHMKVIFHKHICKLEEVFLKKKHSCSFNWFKTVLYTHILNTYFSIRSN